MQPIPGNSIHAHKGRRLGCLVLIASVIALLSLFVLNTSRAGGSVEGCPQGCAVAGARQPGPLRLVSFNMLHGFPTFSDLPARLELIESEMQDLDADIVLLQEVPWTRRTGNGAAWLANRLGFNYLYYRANGNRHLIFFEEGEAILSRFPLQEISSTELLPRMDFFESRVSLHATAITPYGELSLFVAHLTNKDPQVGEGQADSLRRFVQAYAHGPAVVAGDFNAREDGTLIISLSNDWIDSYRSLHPDDPGLTCCIEQLQAGPDEPLEERIDYIFWLPRDGQLISARKVFDQPFGDGATWQWASDHVGLMVELEP